MSTGPFSPGNSERTVRDSHGRVLEVPAGWALLPPGDAALTRRVKAAGDLRYANGGSAVGDHLRDERSPVELPRFAGDQWQRVRSAIVRIVSLSRPAARRLQIHRELAFILRRAAAGHCQGKRQRCDGVEQAADAAGAAAAALLCPGFKPRQRHKAANRSRKNREAMSAIKSHSQVGGNDWSVLDPFGRRCGAIRRRGSRRRASLVPRSRHC